MGMKTKTVESRVGEHEYRKGVKARDLISFRVLIKETDLLISASCDLLNKAKDIVFHYRRQLEDYIKDNPVFFSTLLPYPNDVFAPDIVKRMISATRIFGIGPMASVAGAIAEFVGKELLNYSEEIIVENGGDIFLKTNNSVTVSIFAGRSKFSKRLGIVMHTEQIPAGVSTSSSTIGHSLSFGNTDAVCIVADSASIADAAATALGNKIKDKLSFNREIALIKDWKDIRGGIVIVGNQMATWGNIELINTDY